MNKNTVWQDYQVHQGHREQLHGHKGLLVWFTGLSGSGKSTLANALEAQLHALGISTFTLDGDNVRQGLCKDLGFGPQDRRENLRRIGETAHLMVQAGLVTLAAFVSPYREDRAMVKDLVGQEQMVEVYVNTSLSLCEQRDVKGLYAQARAGAISNMTGIDAPYEPPLVPDLELNTDGQTVEESVQLLMNVILKKINL